MFEVLHKETENVYRVYKVHNNTNGYPMFLIYDDTLKWTWQSAKHFVPHSRSKLVPLLCSVALLTIALAGKKHEK